MILFIKKNLFFSSDPSLVPEPKVMTDDFELLKSGFALKGNGVRFQAIFCIHAYICERDHRKKKKKKGDLLEA